MISIVNLVLCNILPQFKKHCIKKKKLIGKSMLRIWEFRFLVFYLVDVDVTGDEDRWEKKEEYNWDKLSWIKQNNTKHCDQEARNR